MKTITLFLRNFILPILLSILFQSVTFSQNAYQYECISVDVDGFVTIKIWNPQKGKCYKFNQARKDAILAILFSGIPSNNGCIKQKPFLQTLEEQENFNNIKKEFFGTKGAWPTYASASETEATIPVNIGTKNWKVFKVSVTKDQLRKYLEEKRIIKPLNEGF